MNSVQDVWQKVLNILSGQLTQTAMDTWFADCIPEELDDCRLVLCTTTDFKQDILQKRFADRIESAGIHSEIYGSDHCPVELVIR